MIEKYIRIVLSLVFLLITVNLSACYTTKSNGIGGTVSMNEPFKLAPSQIPLLENRAINNNDILAAIRLAQFYGLVGTGNYSEDLEKQIKWLKFAGNRGDLVSQHNAGMTLMISKRYSEAIIWFTMSYFNGMGNDAYYLGLLYEKLEDKNNLIIADGWYGIAAYQGNSFAILKKIELSVNGKLGKKRLVEAYSWILTIQKLKDIKKDSGFMRTRKIETHNLEKELSKKELVRAEVVSEKILLSILTQGENGSE